jgi:hypothetical protein
VKANLKSQLGCTSLVGIIYAVRLVQIFSCVVCRSSGLSVTAFELLPITLELWVPILTSGREFFSNSEWIRGAYWWRLMKKPVFGPERVGFLGTIALTGISGIISWTVIWVPVLYLKLQVMLTQSLSNIMIFFVFIYAPLWAVAQVLTRYLIWQGRSEI